MLCLSQSVGYAIQALACLETGCNGSRLTREVAVCSGVPAPYLAKLFKRLSDAGIIRSKRGYKGGNWLNLPASEITLLEISEVIDGRKWMGKCLLGLEDCSDDRDCPTHAFWKVERAKIEQQLRSITLADVIAFENKRGTCATVSLTQENQESHNDAKPHP